MAERNYEDECGDHGGNGGDCGLPAGWGTDFGTGKCKHHRGTSPDGESHEGNDFAVIHGSYANDFMDGFLTNAEQRRVREAAEYLGEEATAKEHGQLVASMCMEQFRRTGDERFLRRYESICDKFGITPADEIDVSGELDLTPVIDFEQTDT